MRLLSSAILFAASTVVCAQQTSPAADPWLVVPGKSVGPVTAQTTPADLKRLFGDGNVRDAQVSMGGDSEPELATIVHGADAESALTIFWGSPDPKAEHPAVNAHPAWVNLCNGDSPIPKSCKWHLANKIGFGTSLRELEKLNGRPFRLSGFEWDFSGSVTDWKGGKLQHDLASCGRILLRLEPRYPEGGPTANQQKLLEKVIGDGDFPSADPAMQQLNPAVDSISVELPKGGCPAG